MKQKWTHAVCLVLLNLVLVPSSPLLQAQQKSQNKVQKETAPMKLKVGDTAPDFTLLAFDGKELKKVSSAGLQRERKTSPWRSSSSPSPVVEPVK